MRTLLFLLLATPAVAADLRVGAGAGGESHGLRLRSR
jgi:hypothetical protein